MHQEGPTGGWLRRGDGRASGQGTGRWFIPGKRAEGHGYASRGGNGRMPPSREEGRGPWPFIRRGGEDGSFLEGGLRAIAERQAGRRGIPLDPPECPAVVPAARALGEDVDPLPAAEAVLRGPHGGLLEAAPALRPQHLASAEEGRRETPLEASV
eukprot:CAMPEP_0177611582 /NCGR_PEP_ID=MMETSP0419_2-20121207/20597_1 /TAXON_ID=582737 /ORGANISM="Tetraselmis sp., Strain GSL018" /LENGTH=154 /DNA_ID=CAMNT_0019107379 /DNA_START=103 /DNA_END=567 /DNA_ORIENTATION=+